MKYEFLASDKITRIYPRLNYSKEYQSVFFHLPKNAGKSVCKALGINTKNHPSAFKGTTLIGTSIEASYENSVWNNLNKFTIIRNPWDRMVSLYHFRKKENDLLIRMSEKHLGELWTPETGDKSQEEWTFKKWLLDPRVAGVYKFELFPNYKNNLNHPAEGPEFSGTYMGFYRNSMEYLNQLDVITDNNQALLVDYIIKYETLEQDWKNMFNHLNMQAPELPVINKSNHQNYRKYYDSETDALVRYLFKKDIEYFNYEF